MYKKVDCVNCFTGKDSIFHVLNKTEIELLKKNHVSANYRKGEIVYKEGDRPNGVLFLCKGKVKVFKEGVGGRYQIIRLNSPINFIGFRAIFAEDNYIASAVAIEDCSICIIEKKILVKLIKSNSELSLNIIKELATELGHSNERTISLTQKHIRGRLAESLLFLVETFGYEEDKKTIKVYLSREDLANLSNMTTSNAIRTLSAFAAENVIKVDGRRVSVSEFKQLRSISELG